MGLKNYLKAGKKGNKSEEPQHGAVLEMSTPSQTFDEKPPAPFGPYGHNSSRASISPSVKSGRSSFMEDIRHEVMVNYLFQQQCGRMWIGDGSGESEGVLVRKSKASYLACPPDLMHSRFAVGIAALHVPCAMTINSRVVKTYVSQLQTTQTTPTLLTRR